MAGLYDRVARIDHSIEHVDIHILVAGIKASAAGLWNEAQILAALNNSLTTPLSGSEVTDLQDILAVVSGKPSTTAKLVYVVGAVEPTMLAGARVLVTDSQFRTALEI